MNTSEHPAPVATSRLVNVGLRAAHLLATGIYAGGLAWDVPRERLRPWRNLTIATGAALLVAEASASPNWPHQCRGLTTVAHLAVLTPARLLPGLAGPAAMAATLIGAVGSHLPRSIRKWSVLRRQELR